MFIQNTRGVQNSELGMTVNFNDYFFVFIIVSYLNYNLNERKSEWLYNINIQFYNDFYFTILSFKNYQKN